ncbi:MAG: UDP-N-acetylmuramate--L-alanine ligase [Bacteroidales bacterium]
MDITISYKNVFFLGIGGIGMSALARFFISKGMWVYGYDLTPSVLTHKLEDEGANIIYSDDSNLLSDELTPFNTLVVYTPAVPIDLEIFKVLVDRKFAVMKRAEVLGEISKMYKTLAVAGTHGKTSVSTLLAHIMWRSHKQCVGILGGISLNYDSNILLPTEGSDWLITEADEFDRSFLQLSVQKAVISSVDADHLDVYVDGDNMEQAYKDFIDRIEPAGVLVTKPSITRLAAHRNDLRVFTYSSELSGKLDLCPTRIEKNEMGYILDVKTPCGVIEGIELKMLGEVNIENVVAAIAIASLSGISADDIKQSINTFKGVYRRFQLVYSSEDIVYIDDYAHHPTEISATVSSVKKYFPNKKIVGIFQPHLYSRTHDFAEEFAASLDLLDECYLLEIYPAREKPMKGVNSGTISARMKNKNVKIVDKSEISSIVEGLTNTVLLTIGAGDIGLEADRILSLLNSK